MKTLAPKGAWLAGRAALALLVATCSTLRPTRSASTADVKDTAAWDTVYRVLQHPRCLNCHPVGDRPLQGEDSHVHAQNVQRGPDGKGLFAMRCDACHQTENLAGAHLPPGAPNWHLPEPGMPLVFEGRSSSELCRQLRDPAQNGGRTPDELLHHMAEDALVLWGWNPGEGRQPIPIPHEELVTALRSWIAGGCDCP